MSRLAAENVLGGSRRLVISTEFSTPAGAGKVTDLESPRVGRCAINGRSGKSLFDASATGLAVDASSKLALDPPPLFNVDEGKMQTSSVGGTGSCSSYMANI